MSRRRDPAYVRPPLTATEPDPRRRSGSARRAALAVALLALAAVVVVALRGAQDQDPRLRPPAAPRPAAAEPPARPA